DLVLLDLLMPGADGFKVLEHCGKAEQGVPIVVLSGLNYAWTAATAMRLGALDYVTKPFDEEALLILVREILAPMRNARQVTQIRAPQLGLLGISLGVYATLTVLLGKRYRIKRYSNLVEALAYPTMGSADVFVVHMGSLGVRSTESIARIRELLPRGH